MTSPKTTVPSRRNLELGLLVFAVAIVVAAEAAVEVAWDGKITGWMGKLGPGPYEYSEAHYMAISPDLKFIYAADSLGNKIHKYVRNN